MNLKKLLTQHEVWKKKRKSSGLSQSQVAEEIGITQKRFSDWENGHLADSLMNVINKIKSVDNAIDKLKEKK